MSSPCMWDYVAVKACSQAAPVGGGKVPGCQVIQYGISNKLQALIAGVASIRQAAVGAGLRQQPSCSEAVL